jgi:predicted nucleic acid-binding protein
VSAAVTVLDASVWIGWLLADDAHHASSRRWLIEYLAGGGRLVAPMILLAEVGGAVARRTGDTALAHRAVQGFLRLPSLRLVTVGQRLGASAAELAVDLRLRGADALYVATADYLGVPLVTWDQEQVSRARPRIAVYTP